MAFTQGDSVIMSVPITKSEEADDGTVYVEGLCTDDGIDLDDQIIDREFAAKGLEAWFQDWGNVRQQHASHLPPAGKAVSMEKRADGIWIRTHVVEPTAIALVKANVYQAYSVGIAKPRIVRDAVAKGGRVVDGVFSEISLVDFPANPRARFQLAKRAKDGEVEIVEKHLTEKDPEVVESLEKSVPTPAEVFGTPAEPVEKKEEPVLTKSCPGCGHEETAESVVKFCPEDGSKLIEKGAEAEPTAPAAPAPVVEKAAYHLQRLHDALCPGFRSDDVLAAHPVVSKGIADLFEADYWREEVTKALTDPEKLAKLPDLSGMFGLAMEVKQADPALLAASVEDLRKSFAEAYPEAHPTPAEIQPGTYQRSYDAPALTPAGATGATPRLPLATHVPTADAERLVAQKAAQDVLVVVHDYLAKDHAAMCPVDMSSVRGQTIPTPARADNQDTSVPTPTAPLQTMPVTKSEETAPVVAPVDSELIANLVAAEVAKAFEARAREAEKIEKRISALESAPSPYDVAYRGAALLQEAAGNRTEQTAAGRSEADPDAVRKTVALVKRAKSSDPATRTSAIQELFGTFTPDEVAELLEK